MTKYEIMFIVKATLEEDKIKKVADELQKLINISCISFWTILRSVIAISYSALYSD